MLALWVCYQSAVGNFSIDRRPPPFRDVPAVQNWRSISQTTKMWVTINVIAMLWSQLLSAITHCDSHPTLPLTVTSNPQDPTRYSTMDNWLFWAALCSAVFTSSRGLFWARHWATLTYLSSVLSWLALHSSCIFQWRQGHNMYNYTDNMHTSVSRPSFMTTCRVQDVGLGQ